MEWISVKDRLPKTYKEVLVFDGCFLEPNFAVGFYDEGRWGASDGMIEANYYDSGCCINLDCDVKYWMEIPELPNAQD